MELDLETFEVEVLVWVVLETLEEVVLVGVVLLEIWVLRLSGVVLVGSSLRSLTTSSISMIFGMPPKGPPKRL